MLPTTLRQRPSSGSGYRRNAVGEFTAKWFHKAQRPPLPSLALRLGKDRNNELKSFAVLQGRTLLIESVPETSVQAVFSLAVIK